MVSKNKWDEYYNKKGYFLKYPDENLIRFIFTELKNNKNEKLKILDVGCGIGRNSIFMANEGFDVYGIDISKEALNIAKKKAKEKKLSINYIYSNFSDLSFENNSFDAVVDIQSIQHNRINEIKKIFSEVFRVLKKGGKFFSLSVSKEDHAIRKGEEIEENTLKNIREGTFEGVGITHFFTIKELYRMLNNFNKINIESYKRSFNDRTEKISYYLIKAEK